MVILQKFCTENCQDAFADIKFKEMPNVVSNRIGNHFIYKTMILTTLMVSCVLMQSELRRAPLTAQSQLLDGYYDRTRNGAGPISPKR